MIEVVFGDSACGSLKIAQHYGQGKYNSCVSIIFDSLNGQDGSKPSQDAIKKAQQEAEERERRAWENATPMSGNPADIYAFALALGIGDISENTLGDKRQRVLEQLYGGGRDPSDEDRKLAQTQLQETAENLKTVCRRAASGEPLRIWYSNQPDELCGLYWLMTQLNQPENVCSPVYLVKLPEWEDIEGGNMVRKTSWGETGPGEWHRYLPLQKTASKVFRQSCASHWSTLQKENAPLRAMLNGQLVSAPETLYDAFIAREIAAADEEFHEAQLIGQIMGKYQLGIGDIFLALRIEEMIRAGVLEAVTNAPKGEAIYRRILKKTR